MEQLFKQPTKRGRKLARSPGHSPRLPHNGEPQQLTDVRFMNRSQREAFKQGKEIWV
jgi:hypothetical protein